MGAAEAGKSTLIGALSPGAMNLAVNGRTVAMDHGTLERAGRTLSLVGVPGQQRFAPVREVLVSGALGLVWVHRHGRAVDRDTAGLVAALCAEGVPYIVFVNCPGSWPGDDGWQAPRDLPRPRVVLGGDPLTDSVLVRCIQEEIWRLVASDSSGSQKGA